MYEFCTTNSKVTIIFLIFWCISIICDYEQNFFSHANTELENNQFPYIGTKKWQKNVIHSSWILFAVQQTLGTTYNNEPMKRRNFFVKES